eukprot:343377-Rhodomonas_salina.2
MAYSIIAAAVPVRATFSTARLGYSMLVPRIWATSCQYRAYDGPRRRQTAELRPYRAPRASGSRRRGGQGGSNRPKAYPSTGRIPR